jgi:hypothetical protein
VGWGTFQRKAAEKPLQGRTLCTPQSPDQDIAEQFPLERTRSVGSRVQPALKKQRANREEKNDD